MAKAEAMTFTYESAPQNADVWNQSHYIPVSIAAHSEFLEGDKKNPQSKCGPCRAPPGGRYFLILPRSELSPATDGPVRCYLNKAQCCMVLFFLRVVHCRTVRFFNKRKLGALQGPPFLFSTDAMSGAPVFWRSELSSLAIVPVFCFWFLRMLFRGVVACCAPGKTPGVTGTQYSHPRRNTRAVSDESPACFSMWESTGCNRLRQTQKNYGIAECGGSQQQQELWEIK